MSFVIQLQGIKTIKHLSIYLSIYKEKEVQASPTETNGCLGAVHDRQQERTTITPLLFPPELTCL